MNSRFTKLNVNDCCNLTLHVKKGDIVKCQDFSCNEKIYVHSCSGHLNDLKCGKCCGNWIKPGNNIPEHTYTTCLGCNCQFMLMKKYYGKKPHCPNCRDAKPVQPVSSFKKKSLAVPFVPVSLPVSSIFEPVEKPVKYCEPCMYISYTSLPRENHDFICGYCYKYGEDVSFAPNPFRLEIYEDETNVWMCSNCRHESYMDI